MGIGIDSVELACEASLNWLASYPGFEGGGAEKAYNQVRAAIAQARAELAPMTKAEMIREDQNARTPDSELSKFELEDVPEIAAKNRDEMIAECLRDRR